MSDTFPRQHARTRRFTLGEPRSVTVSPDGRRVVFARSRGGDDPVNCLWRYDVDTATEHLVADPRALLAGDLDDLPPEERARRERAREAGGGIVAYATDVEVRVCAFALAGRLFVGGLLTGTARELGVPGPVFDPRPDPTARRVAYVQGDLLRVAELDGRSAIVADDPGDADVSWGSAEFIAAEEMGRSRGYWWAPDGERLAVARVDTSPVGRWWIGNPADPAAPPSEHAYPAAGTDNASVTLHVVALDGTMVEVDWNRQEFPYLVDVTWPENDGLLVTVQSRDQRRVEVRAVDPKTGTSEAVFLDGDETWVELVPGTPGRLDGGRLVTAADRDGARRLLVDGVAVTPADLQVRSVVACGGDDVVFTANALDEPTELHVWRWSVAAESLVALTTEPGVHSAVVGGPTTSSCGRPGSTTTACATWLLESRRVDRVVRRGARS